MAKARREPSDLRCAWRKMTAEERTAALRWIAEESLAVSGDGLDIAKALEAAQ